jgi:hypothetical protein
MHNQPYFVCLYSFVVGLTNLLETSDGEKVGQQRFSAWSGIPQASLRSPASFRPGIIPTMHEINVGESQHGSTTAMGFAQCDCFAALGFLTARFARNWDFRRIPRKILGSRRDVVPW